MAPLLTSIPKASNQLFLKQSILCVLCMLVGAFYPTLLDYSKTALEQHVTLIDGTVAIEERRAYPFSPVSVVFINDALQLSIALCVVAMREGLPSIVANKGVVLKMMPLGAIYAIGELLTLRSVQKGSGPVYVVIANMKLVVAALMSRAFFGKCWAMPWLHWLELVLISVAAAAYTLSEAGALGSQWDWEGAWMALTKSSLVAFSSVFCEHTYKNNPFHAVLTLQAAWGLITISALIGLSFAGSAFDSVALELHDDAGSLALFAGGPGLPLCASGAHKVCVASLKSLSTTAAANIGCRCISQRGWDSYTILTVIADLSNAISSALIFKRLSAVAKYVCRATSAVPMYIFYCVVGRSSWSLRTFAIVIYLCAQVSVYTVQRNRAAEIDAKAEWTKSYSAVSTNDAGSSVAEGKRK